MKKSVAVLILAVVGFLIYLPSFGNPFIWDDEQFIVKNVYVNNFDVERIFTGNTTEGAGVISNYYRPLTTLSFAIDKAIWGFRPLGFHLTNTLMHVGAGVCLFLVLSELEKGNQKSKIKNQNENVKIKKIESVGLEKARKMAILKPVHTLKLRRARQVQDDGQEEVGRSLMPFWVAMLFLIHPIQTEAVVYMNSRGDSFYTFLLFAGLYLFARSYGEQANRQTEKQRNRETGNQETRSVGLSFRPKRSGVEKSLSRSMGLRERDSSTTLGMTKQMSYLEWLVGNKAVLLSFSVILYGLAILAKEIAVAGVGLFGLVFLMKVIQRTGKQEIRNKEQEIGGRGVGLVRVVVGLKAQVMALVSMVGVLGLYLLARLTVLNFDNSLNFYGDTSNPYAESLWVRMLTLGKIFWTYPRLLLWPWPLHMERTSEVFLHINGWFVAMVVALLVIPVLGWWEWRSRKTTWIGFGYLWYVGMMVPVSGIVAINGLIYEHWLYVPMVGFWLMGYGVGRVVSDKGLRMVRSGEAWLSIVMVLVVVVLGGLTVRQNLIWGDHVRFYEYTLRYGESVRLHNNLGMAYASRGEHERALVEYVKALELADVYPQVHHNIGEVYTKLGDIELAQAAYEQAISMSEGFYYSYTPLVSLYLDQGKLDKALPLVDKLLEINPNEITYLVLRGVIALGQGEEEKARAILARAIQVSGNSQQVKSFTAEVLADDWGSGGCGGEASCAAKIKKWIRVVGR